MARVISELDRDLILVVMAGPGRKELEEIGRNRGIRIAFEFFADRAYNPDGTLVSRREPGAVIHDQQAAAERVLKLAREGKVTAVDGTDIALQAETICVHGDNPAAVQLRERSARRLSAPASRSCPWGRLYDGARRTAHGESVALPVDPRSFTSLQFTEKLKIRNPKHEIRNKYPMLKIQMTKTVEIPLSCFGIFEFFCFVFVSNFGFRYSNLVAAAGPALGCIVI